ncbi:MAG: Spx/MgsR family RNA polymerase-binding regulatory protein [Mycoplasma sp.]
MSNMKDIVIYMSPSCTSCRKVKKWFKKEQVPFVEKNIIMRGIKKEDIKKIVNCSDNGFSDILSERSSSLKKLNVNLEQMTSSQMIDLIHENPGILKRPIILQEDKNRVLVGFNAEQIEIFAKED